MIMNKNRLKPNAGADVFNSLDEFIRTNSYNIDGVVFCALCDYSNKYSSNLKTHIETNHVDQEQRKVYCEHCDYVGPSRSALRMHMKKHF